ncbi:DNA cross-link repair protein SNM1-like isoform X2 [Nilaparvata lugens]|nr:DNA cross-link repair protein SNM1-like isoform X2 [Nilaparvata lugens]
MERDLHLDSCVKIETPLHNIQSEDESGSGKSSSSDGQHISKQIINQEKSQTSKCEDSNLPSTEIDLQLDDLKFEDELSIESSSKNSADSEPSSTIQETLLSSEDVKKVKNPNENDKTKRSTDHPKFDFFAPKKPGLPDKRSKPKKVDITYSNVKTVIPGSSDEPSVGPVKSEKTDNRATGNSWRKFGSKSNVPKVCPFYKRIPDTNFVVDAFQYGSIPGVQAYFLSHFHSDHYIGLRKGFSHPIYCSKITANLVKMKLGVNERYINVINLNERTVVNGVEVVALDANHCPGSVMLLFQLRTGQNYLHVGDFRANTEMESYPELKQLRIHKLFLDTTYCKPAYTFPSQQSVIDDVLKIVKTEFMMNPRTLIVVGSYLIGKEKVFMAIAEEFDCRIWAEPSKLKIFDCIESKELKKRVTSEASLAQVHVVSMAHLEIHKLKDYLRPFMKVFSRVVAFRPTGWCHNSGSSSSGSSSFKRLEYENVVLYEVPYSEHSSYTELQRFVQFTKPDSIVPTVNVNESSLKEMNKHFKSWLNETSQSSILDFVKGAR